MQSGLMQNCLVRAVSGLGMPQLLILLICAAPCQAQIESARVTVLPSVSFAVTDIRTSTGATPHSYPVRFTDAHLLPGHALRISVKADMTTFTGEGNATLPCSLILWTLQNVSGGAGTAGVLSEASFSCVFQGDADVDQGGFDLILQLTAPPAGVLAGSYDLTLTWKIESVDVPGKKRSLMYRRAFLRRSPGQRQ